MIVNKFKAACETCGKPAEIHVVAEGWDDCASQLHDLTQLFRQLQEWDRASNRGADARADRVAALGLDSHEVLNGLAYGS